MILYAAISPCQCPSLNSRHNTATSFDNRMSTHMNREAAHQRCVVHHGGKELIDHYRYLLICIEVDRLRKSILPTDNKGPRGKPDLGSPQEGFGKLPQ